MLGRKTPVIADGINRGDGLQWGRPMLGRKTPVYEVGQYTYLLLQWGRPMLGRKTAVVGGTDRRT